MNLHVSFLVLFPFVGSSDKTNLAADVAVACLNNANSNFRHHDDGLKTFSAMLFPLLLILPKVLFFCVEPVFGG